MNFLPPGGSADFVVGLMIGAVLIVVGLEYLPAFALAPIAESLS